MATSTRTKFTVAQGIERGLRYRFKYRVSNVNGWSDFSDTSYIFAYAAPSKPPAPIYVSGTDTSVTLEFMPSRRDNGVRIALYKIFIDQGDDT